MTFQISQNLKLKVTWQNVTPYVTLASNNKATTPTVHVSEPVSMVTMHDHCQTPQQQQSTAIRHATHHVHGLRAIATITLSASH